MQVKRFFLSWFLLTAMCLSASAYDFEVDGIYYSKTSENTVEVTTKNRVTAGKSHYQGAITVPEKVIVDGVEYTVTSIGDLAFSSSAVKSVILPQTVKAIYEGAFYGAGINSIQLPESLETIGTMAFYSSELESVELPEGLKTIGYDAFSVTNIKTVLIPSTVVEIGPTPFRSVGYTHEDGITHGLGSVRVAEGNPVYDSRNNCNAIIETATNKLIQASLSTVIPEDVTTIAACAFAGMQDISIIYLPASIQTCERSSLADCIHLTDIYLAATTPPEATAIFGVGPVREYEEVVLHVPNGTKVLYQTSTEWKSFKHIEEFDPSTFENPTALESIATDNPIHNHAAVYDLQGREIKPHPCLPQKGREKSISEGNKRNLPKGINIVNGKKVVVR